MHAQFRTNKVDFYMRPSFLKLVNFKKEKEQKAKNLKTRLLYVKINVSLIIIIIS